MTATTAPASDSDVILPQPSELSIGGIEVEVGRLKTREFLSLMRVLLRGMGGDIVDLFSGRTEEEIQGRLMGSVLAAIPNAQNEFILFLQTIVKPKDKRQQSKLLDELENPDLEELIAIVTVIITNEAPEFERLGKMMRTWWETVGKATLSREQEDG